MPGRPFRPSLMFVVKSGAFQKAEEPKRCLTLVGSSLNCKHKARLKRPARDKHSSLLQTFVNYICIFQGTQVVLVKKIVNLETGYLNVETTSLKIARIPSSVVPRLLVLNHFAERHSTNQLLIKCKCHFKQLLRRTNVLSPNAF